MSEVNGAYCPWMEDGHCHTNCMLFDDWIAENEDELRELLRGDAE